MLKKILLIIIGLGLVVVLSLGAIGFAYAQSSNPSDGTATPLWGGHGGMMSGDRGGMMGGHDDGNYGPMHEYMIAALANGLGMTAEELQARLDAGETSYQVAQSLGLSDGQITALFDEAHDQAIQAAVEADSLTQEQADWMEQHHDQMWENGTRPGTGGCTGDGHGMKGGQGRGRWQNQP